MSIVDRVREVADRMGVGGRVRPVRGMPFGRGVWVGFGGTPMRRRVVRGRETWGVGCLDGLSLPQALEEAFRPAE